jgi:hypothetical protein
MDEVDRTSKSKSPLSAFVKALCSYLPILTPSSIVMHCGVDKAKVSVPEHTYKHENIHSIDAKLHNKLAVCF